MNDNLVKSLGGYVEYSLSPFPVQALIDDDNNPFPLASAIALNFYNGTDDATDYYFQPYHISVDCLMNSSLFRFPAELDDFPFGLNSETDVIERLPYFREDRWDRFTGRNNIDNVNSGNYSQCVNGSYPCRLVLCVSFVLKVVLQMQ